MRTENPTIVSPVQYMKRFRRNVPLYFDTVPDGWSGLTVLKRWREIEERERKEREEEWRRLEREKGS